VSCASRGLVSDTPCRKSEVAVAPCFWYAQGAKLCPAMPVCCGSSTVSGVGITRGTSQNTQAHKGQRVGHDTESPYLKRRGRGRRRGHAMRRALGHQLCSRRGEARRSDRVETVSSGQLFTCPPPRAYKNRSTQTRRTTTIRRSACPCYFTMGSVRRVSSFEGEAPIFFICLDIQRVFHVPELEDGRSVERRRWNKA